uniref:Uncharacterized protein n=1 Tax=Oryza punctata TaxID=4537 RepID=A0A0E0K2I8_ORYPU
MEESDESAAEAALGLSAPFFVNSVLNAVDDVRYGAFEYCLQEGAPEAVGATTAAQKAEELERGVISIHNLVKDVLDKRMGNWEKYCLRHCFAIPEGFLMREDDIPAKKSLNDGNSDSDLDAELVSLRKKLEDANNESEELQTELSSLERQAERQRNLDSSMAELLKMFESKSFQDNFQDLVNVIPLFQQKLKGMKRKIVGSIDDQNDWNVNGLRHHKRLASGFTASTEDSQDVVCVLKKY